MKAVAVKKPLLTWDDVLHAAEGLVPEQRNLVREIATERGATGSRLEVSDGPWYLAGIEVRGHAGIGQDPVRLPLTPTPGLTIVTARNGVGKTSIAHAIRHTVGNGNQTPFAFATDNIHSRDRRIVVRITNGPRSVELVCDKGGVLWNEEGDEPGPRPLAWLAALERYMPILLYPEISPVIERPGDLHTFLREALSLTVLEELLQSIDQFRGDGRTAQKVLDGPYRRASGAAGSAGDSALADTIKSVGARPQPAALETLRALAAALPATLPPTPATVPMWTVDESVPQLASASAEALRAARSDVVAGADRVQKALDLLVTTEAAYVADLRDQDRCPVCGTTGGRWFETATTEAQTLRKTLASLRGAERSAADAIARAKRAAPPALTPETRVALDRLVDAERWMQRWDEVTSRFDELTADNVSGAVVAALVAESKDLADWYRTALDAITTGRDNALAARVEIRAAVDAWLDEVERTRPDLDRADLANALAKIVETWIKDTREAIFEPIGSQIVQIWADLNADSDLGIANVNLSGGVRKAKKVDLTLSVDGTPLPGARDNSAILSTGQRNALSLAAYLPRATQPTSPFGFLVLDDPIHAFDSWRIRYLAKRIIDLSNTYQIVILTHDDRLWQELRAAGCWPTHIRLDRPGGGQSQVRVKNATRPGQLMLDDLQRVVNQERREALGTDEAQVTLTLAMCRQALDTEVTTQIEILGRRLGKSEEDIQGEVDRARSTREQLDLLNTYARANGLTSVAYQRFIPTIDVLNEAAHGRFPARASLSDCRDWMLRSRRLIQQVYAVAG